MSLVIMLQQSVWKSGGASVDARKVCLATKLELLQLLQL